MFFHTMTFNPNNSKGNLVYNKLFLFNQIIKSTTKIWMKLQNECFYRYFLALCQIKDFIRWGKYIGSPEFNMLWYSSVYPFDYDILFRAQYFSFLKLIP